jgi:hypothetical protein
VTNEQITRTFMEKGWEIRYRGGNSRCTTPSDLDMIIADVPRSPSTEGSIPWLESPSRYSIAVCPSRVQLCGARGAVFDLYDAERGVSVGVRRVPTPELAAKLLARYGVPESEVWAHKPVMVPEGVESAGGEYARRAIGGGGQHERS